MKSRGLIFGSERVATPAEVSFTNNKIWSNNAGRTANCKMVGDIRAIKKTVTLKWYHLTGEETAKLNEYISNVDSPFSVSRSLMRHFRKAPLTFMQATQLMKFSAGTRTNSSAKALRWI